MLKDMVAEARAARPAKEIRPRQSPFVRSSCDKIRRACVPRSPSFCYCWLVLRPSRKPVRPTV
jgi:hypothetical protein